MFQYAPLRTCTVDVYHSLSVNELFQEKIIHQHHLHCQHYRYDYSASLVDEY